MIEIDWAIVSLQEMQQILSEQVGYIDGDKKKIIIEA